MHATRLKVQNFGGIEIVDVPLAEGLNTVAGNNGSGKSSLIAALRTAALGKEGLPPAALHHGAQKGTVDVALSDGSRITASITDSGTWSFKLLDATGAQVASPAARLKALRGAAGPDPIGMAFATDPRSAILQALGVDTTALDREEARLREERTVVGRDTARLKGLLESLQPMTEAPADEVSIADLARELTRAEAANLEAIQRETQARQRLEEIDRQRAALHRAQASASSEEDALAQIVEPGEDVDVAALEAALAAARAQNQRNAEIRSRRRDAADRARKAVVLVEDVQQRLDAAIKAPVPEPITVPDVAALRQRLEEADATNALVRANKKRTDAEKELSAKRASYEVLSGQIDGFPAKRNSLLTGLDVPGLVITADAVSLHGVPWAAASTGQRLTAAIAIRAATKADLALAWTTEGDKLDERHLAEVATLCERHGLQLVMELTGEDHEGALILRNGKVAS